MSLDTVVYYICRCKFQTPNVKFGIYVWENLYVYHLIILSAFTSTRTELWYTFTVIYLISVRSILIYIFWIISVNVMLKIQIKLCFFKYTNLSCYQNTKLAQYYTTFANTLSTRLKYCFYINFRKLWLN